MRVELVQIGGPCSTIIVDELPALIGRDPSAEVCVDDSWVGRYQCILEQDGNWLMVLDLGTKTGTFVNGRRVARAFLTPGDILTMGRTDFCVHYASEISAGPVTRPREALVAGRRN